MATVLRIPSGLRRITNGVETVELPSSTVEEALDRLDSQFPGIKDRLLDEDSEVRPFIAIFLNGSDINDLHGLRTYISDGDEIDIVPAIAGGAHTGTFE